MQKTVFVGHEGFVLHLGCCNSVSMVSVFVYFKKEDKNLN